MRLLMNLNVDPVGALSLEGGKLMIRRSFSPLMQRTELQQYSAIGGQPQPDSGAVEHQRGGINALGLAKLGAAYFDVSPGGKYGNPRCVSLAVSYPCRAIKSKFSSLNILREVLKLAT